jgi:hypothetical protein
MIVAERVLAKVNHPRRFGDVKTLLSLANTAQA